jgi:hypothetical protein
MVDLMIIAALVTVTACGFVVDGPFSRTLDGFAAVASRIGDILDEMSYAAVRQRELVLGTAVPNPAPEQQPSESR